MRPFTAINGIVFGSAVAILLGLACTLVVMAVLVGDAPRLKAEFRPLLTTTALFFAVSLATGAAFVGHLGQRAWRWWAQLGSVAAVAAAVAYFVTR
jgi:hypothetical protein